MSAGRITEGWVDPPLQEDWVAYDAKRKARLPLGSKVRVDTRHLAHLGFGRSAVGEVVDTGGAGVHYVRFPRYHSTLDVHPHQIKEAKKPKRLPRNPTTGAPRKRPSVAQAQRSRRLSEDRDASAANEHRNVKCPKCDRVQSATHKKCSKCGHDLAAARRGKFANLSEAFSEAARDAALDARKRLHPDWKWATTATGAKRALRGFAPGYRYGQRHVGGVELPHGVTIERRNLGMYRTTGTFRVQGGARTHASGGKARVFDTEGEAITHALDRVSHAQGEVDAAKKLVGKKAVIRTQPGGYGGRYEEATAPIVAHNPGLHPHDIGTVVVAPPEGVRLPRGVGSHRIHHSEVKLAK